MLDLSIQSRWQRILLKRPQSLSTAAKPVWIDLRLDFYLSGPTCFFSTPVVTVESTRCTVHCIRSVPFLKQQYYRFILESAALHGQFCAVSRLINLSCRYPINKYLRSSNLDKKSYRWLLIILINSEQQRAGEIYIGTCPRSKFILDGSPLAKLQEMRFGIELQALVL